jgi:hypothetical protein
MDKDTMLDYAMKLFDELGLKNAARIEVIKRLRERFELGLREAKDIADEAYEELCEEEEEITENDPEIIAHFLESLPGSYDNAFKYDAGFVINSLMNFLQEYEGTSLAKMGTNSADEYMMDYFPRKVTAGEELVKKVPEILTLFFKFAGETGQVKDQGALIHTVESLREEFVSAALNPRNFGPAKTFTTAMLEAGIDPTDQAQVDAFLVQYNRRVQQMLPRPPKFAPPQPKFESPPIKPVAPLPPAKPKVARNAPCPCGSRRKYKKCCGKA